MKKRRRKIDWKSLILSFVLVYSVALFGNIFTQTGINSLWYLTVKPSISPPNWVFFGVWNILFFLIALSLYMSLVSTKNEKLKIRLEIIFGANFILNVFWTMFYFALRKPLYAFFDLIPLWTSIWLMIWVTWKINKKSSWLLVPYLLWVSFAGILNYLSVFR